jgi:hypothetical protein
MTRIFIQGYVEMVTQKTQGPLRQAQGRHFDSRSFRFSHVALAQDDSSENFAAAAGGGTAFDIFAGYA